MGKPKNQIDGIIFRLLKEENVVWRTPKDTTVSSAEKHGLDYVHSDTAENVTKGSGMTPQTTFMLRNIKKIKPLGRVPYPHTIKDNAVGDTTNDLILIYKDKRTSDNEQKFGVKETKWTRCRGWICIKQQFS